MTYVPLFQCGGRHRSTQGSVGGELRLPVHRGWPSLLCGTTWCPCKCVSHRERGQRPRLSSLTCQAYQHTMAAYVSLSLLNCFAACLKLQINYKQIWLLHPQTSEVFDNLVVRFLVPSKVLLCEFCCKPDCWSSTRCSAKQNRTDRKVLSLLSQKILSPSFVHIDLLGVCLVLMIEEKRKRNFFPRWFAAQSRYEE